MNALRQLGTAATALENVANLKEVRSVIRLGGTDLLHFLQGLITNDVSHFDTPNGQIMYACLLNAQGRYLHDMFLHRTADPDPTILLDTDRTGVLDLMRLLKMYRLRQRVDIDDVSAAYHVWTRWSPQQHAGGAHTISSAGSDDEQSNVWRPDPRLTQLGLRALLPSADTHNDSSVTDTAAAVPNSAQKVPWTAYKRFRWQLGVAEGDSEIPSGAAIPFQFNIDGLAGISFSKGCYVGQELMARTHFNGVVRKRLMPFSVTSSSADGVTVVPGADLYAESAAGPKPLGKVQLIEGDAGLGVMRLAPTLAALAAGQPLYVSAGGEETEVKVWRPEWWPPAWGTEE